MNNQEIDKAIGVLSSFDGTEDQDLQEAIEIAVPLLQKKLKALTHQLTNGWISVSERLPECNGRYITTSKLDNYTETEVYDLWLENGIWYTDEKDEEYEGDVIAWRNLPEQYKEVSE